jgi:imidazolonepropionase-like amidohydrolase
MPDSPIPVVVLHGARIYPGPDAPAIARGVVVVRGGTIAAVGVEGQVQVPAGARMIDCSGLTVTAGFWNTHVHFTEANWLSADSGSAAELTARLRAMLTRWGVVRAIDTGSPLANTLALRLRIESGEIPGPQILIASGGFVPVGGSPYYLLPLRLPELVDAGQATAAVYWLLENPGVDAVKLFTGSWAARGSVVVMPVDVVRAAVEAAHGRGKLVIAHPSTSEGAHAALEGGVDILAHTFPSGLDGAWDRSLPFRMRQAGMALIPTLALWPYEFRKVGLDAGLTARLMGNAAAQLKAVADEGGQVLFGTDVGYMTDYDPTEEYVLMQQAGLAFSHILAALTTAPAARFGAANRSGRVAAGMDADLVVLEGDPEPDIRALARVRYTIRGGRVIYEGRP